MIAPSPPCGGDDAVSALFIFAVMHPDKMGAEERPKQIEDCVYMGSAFPEQAAPALGWPEFKLFGNDSLSAP